MHQAQEVTRDATDAQDGSMRLFAAYDVPIKKVKQIAFSNGGHLLVAADKKMIYVMTTYGLELITSIQSPSSQVSKLCFNTSDTTLIFISDDGFLQRFDMVSGFKKKADADVRRNFEYKGIIHVPSENNECMVLTCGREGDSGAFLRTMND
jgi:WD40 repeat protein